MSTRFNKNAREFFALKDTARVQHRWFVVCFAAAWCSLARQLVTIFQEVAAKPRSDVLFCVVQYDDLLETADVADLRTLPSIKFYPPGDRPSFVLSGLSAFKFQDKLPPRAE